MENGDCRNLGNEPSLLLRLIQNTIIKSTVSSLTAGYFSQQNIASLMPNS